MSTRDQVFKRGIARKLVLYILIVSSLITLLATAYQLYSDFRNDVNALENRVHQVELSFAPSIGNALWAFDYGQVESTLQGIVRLPGIHFVRVQSQADETSLQAGVQNAHRVRTKQIDLIANDGQVVGLLEIEANTDAIVSRIKDKAVLVLVSQAIKTFLVSLFMFLIFQKLIIRHLEHIAAFVGQFRPGHWQDLKLDRPERKATDEFDDVAIAFNQMQVELRKNYEEIMATNDALAQKSNELEHHKEQLEETVLQRTKALKDAQNKLIDSAHRAGMAEIAVGTLHHVGNNLNSLNVSCQLLLERLGKSKIDSLAKANELLADAIKSGSESKEPHKLMAFYQKLADQLQTEHGSYLEELKLMQEEIELVKKSVKDQEHYADFNPQFEKVNIQELLEDCLRPFKQSLEENAIAINLEDLTALDVELPRSQMHLVFSHLIKNAIEAMKSTPERCLSLSSTSSKGKLEISVKDSGSGFDKSIKDQLFTYGFSTKTEGQGIGLHFVANSLHALGGSIEASSDGPGRGSNFTVTLPLKA